MDALWIKASLKNQKCSHCKEPLLVENVLGVGAIKPPREEACAWGTKVVVMASCPCRYVTTVAADVRQEDVEAALKGVYQCAWKEFLQKTGVSEKDAEKISKTKPPNQPSKNHGSRDLVKPSIRRCTSKKPITDKEQHRFLRRLQRTSMRIKTKSFKAWLRRLTG